ncbi:MAG: ArsB/NhaD family transporter [Bacteroidota bacterium]
MNLTIASLTLGTSLWGVIRRPKGLPLFLFPLLGALLVLLLGIEPWSALPGIWKIVGDATLTLISLMGISLALDQLGFFRWCSQSLLVLSGGDEKKTWWALMLLAWVVTAVLANDGAMLILVPIYAEMLKGLDRKAFLAFLFPVGFLIDVASTPLVTSNLTNIMLADAFHLSFVEYARLMALPSLALGAAGLGLCWLVFRRHLPTRLDSPDDFDPPHRWIGWTALTLLLLGFSLAHLFQASVSFVVGSVAVFTILAARWKKACTLSFILRKTPWEIVLFAFSLFVLVDALARAGGLAILLDTWKTFAPSWRPLGIGATVGLLSALLNNLPALLLGLLGFQAHPAMATPSALAAALVGANVAPKLTPFGSLATLLWMRLLADRGIRIGWGEYLRLSLWLTPPMVALGLLVAGLNH